MASAARRPCNHPGCGVLLPYGQSYCDQHRKQVRREEDSRRETSAQRGYSSAWRKAREGYLRNHPLCKKHYDAGHLVPATVVDHIKPHQGDKALFWDSDNWQPLCKACHDRKTATEDGGFGRIASGGVGASNL